MKIVLSGFISCGKSTVGDYLVSKHGYVGLSFADSLKDAVSTIFCWDRELLEGITAESRQWRDQVDKWWSEKLGIPNLTPRWVLRNFGTEVMRKNFHPDIWTLNVERRILDLGDRPFVVYDARFRNELDLVKKAGGTAIRVKRGPEPEWYDTAMIANECSLRSTAEECRALMRDKFQVHESEWSWIGYPFDAVINNDGTLETLYREIDRFVGQV